MVIGEEGKPQGYVKRTAHQATSRGIELRNLLSLDSRFSYAYINGMLEIALERNLKVGPDTHTNVRLSRWYSPLPPITPTSTTNPTSVTSNR